MVTFFFLETFQGYDPDANETQCPCDPYQIIYLFLHFLYCSALYLDSDSFYEFLFRGVGYLSPFLLKDETHTHTHNFFKVLLESSSSLIIFGIHFILYPAGIFLKSTGFPS